MDINTIEEIYRDSYKRYNDLYDYFFNFCGFQILTTSLSLGFDIFRIRDYDNLKSIKKKKDVGYRPSPSSEYSRVGIPKEKEIWFYVSDDINAGFAEMLPSWYKKIRPGSNIKVIINVSFTRKNFY